MTAVVILRALVRADLPLVGEWLGAPHVARWWREDASEVAVAARYAPYLEGSDPTVIVVAEHDNRPVGLGQWYDWDASPAARDAYGIPAGTVGIDYLIGHPHDCDRGLGTHLVAALVEATPRVPLWVTPEAANQPSCQVLEKNGFVLMATKQCSLLEEPEAGPTALYCLSRG